jgi:alpha-beta hydrolase superfamily lysophospholipase
MNPGQGAAGRQPRRLRIAKFLAFTAGAAVLAAAPVAGAHAAALPALTCSAYNLPVRIADPGPADQTLWGQLCYRGDRKPGTVQLLVHGATYNHLYWNFPYGNGYYSYAGAATAAGYATFDIDRIGAGNSSHPPSAGLDLAAGAVALHDAVTALRSGAVDGHAFRHVITVGHSIGSVEIWLEAARYHDVDAVIVTGALHALSPGAASILSEPPAQQPSYQITVPVLSVVGEGDNLFCTGVTAYNCASQQSVRGFESQYYSPAAHLRLVVIPGTGHDLALSTTAPLTDAIMVGWSVSAVGPDAP